MKNKPCKKIRLSLVDYSDGALSADKTRQIANHLAQCPACREELRLLEHSLVLAREVWNEAATTEPLVLCDKPLAVPRKIDNKSLAVLRRKRRPLAWICGTAAVCTVVILLLFNRSNRPKKELDIMEYIAREERSARLAASVQLLTDQPGL
ncbi:MAG: zf-HC2 domain-containing protein, partial [Thermoguttaceae bacterium]